MRIQKLLANVDHSKTSFGQGALLIKLLEDDGEVVKQVAIPKDKILNFTHSDFKNVNSAFEYLKTKENKKDYLFYIEEIKRIFSL